ncbi:BA14K family protein [Sinorhizobium glycinis]|uniref:BA14K family protein n=1 Tax=Sinorhizobium glycinis TaxID=1472378 RepID=UPI0009EE62D5|nr:BA14K family protein [Sinorhizobium glycinis]
MKRLAIIALSLATAMSSVPPPAGAFPTVPTIKSEATDVQRVQFSYERGEEFKGRGCRYPCVRGWDRRGYYSNRHYRHGYRRHHYRHYDDDDDDLGALFGGLAAGAIIGGLIAQPRYYAPRPYYAPPAYYAGGNAHTRWCYARYRSYRAYDNTYQPYYGARRLCVSPYL